MKSAVSGTLEYTKWCNFAHSRGEGGRGCPSKIKYQEILRHFANSPTWTTDNISLKFAATPNNNNNNNLKKQQQKRACVLFALFLTCTRSIVFLACLGIMSISTFIAAQPRRMRVDMGNYWPVFHSNEWWSCLLRNEINEQKLCFWWNRLFLLCPEKRVCLVEIILLKIRITFACETTSLEFRISTLSNLLFLDGAKVGIAAFRSWWAK